LELSYTAEKAAHLLSRRNVLRLAATSACGVAVCADPLRSSAFPALGWIQGRLRTHAVHKLAVLFSSKTPDYAIHSKRVARYSVALCHVLKLNADETKRIATAALLHDIGLVALLRSS
jgi:HD-GYP domain-containing protein (c-di-GMP phosphodiesterase class II)